MIRTPTDWSRTPRRVAVAGAAGRMGAETVRAVRGLDDLELVAEIGRGDDLPAVLARTKPDVLVDFTLHDAVFANVAASLGVGVVPLVGVTGGIGASELAAIAKLCGENATACLIAPNFAIGAVLLMQFAQQAARYLPDVEIIEMHHERKADAPSGTARRTAEIIAHARTGTPSAPPDNALELFAGSRGGAADGEIRVHSVRLPGFVASQEVIFGAPGQRLSLRHDSIDRESFMPGVLLAIRQAHRLSGLVVGLENLL